VYVARRARVLLELDENAPPVGSRARVAARVGVSVGTVLNVANDWVASGGVIDEVICYKKRAAPPVEPKLDGEVEARLIAMACSAPPEGYARWSLRLLEKRVKLDPGLPDLDHSTIGRALKKTGFVLI